MDGTRRSEGGSTPVPRRPAGRRRLLARAALLLVAEVPLAGATTPTSLPPMPCSSLCEPGAPCQLQFGAAGRVTDQGTGQPIAGARVELLQSAAVAFTDEGGSYQVEAERIDSCNIDYAVGVFIGADGYAFAAATAYLWPAFLYFDAQLAALPPTETPTPTCTPGPDPEPGCGYAGPTFTPVPTVAGPVVEVDPRILPRLACGTDFDVTIANRGTDGSTLTITGITFAHGYSQGDYGRGFAWDVSGVSFPVALARDASIVIPMQYHGDSYASRVHVTIYSDALNNDPFTSSYQVTYFGALCSTPTPTPAATTSTPQSTETSTPSPTRVDTSTPPPTATAVPSPTAIDSATPTRTPSLAPAPSSTETPPQSPAGSSGGGCCAGRDSSSAILLAIAPLLAGRNRGRVSRRRRRCLARLAP